MPITVGALDLSRSQASNTRDTKLRATLEGKRSMLTYQLQRRYFKCANPTEFKFPGSVKIEFHFEPQEPFGMRHGYSRAALQSVAASILYDANNGRSSVRPERPLAPVEASVHYKDMNFDFRGNKFSVECGCQTQDELAQLIYSIQGLFPPLLNVFLYDAPFITRVSGSVGAIKFRWELAETQFQIQITNEEEQEKRVATALSLYGSDLGTKQYRIHAALGYFYKACRLIAAGNGPWEFMPEAILNLSKSLEILFNNTVNQVENGSRDRIRKGLREIGINDQLIDRVFVRVLILRSEFDVGHGRLALHDMDDLQLIYRFVATAEAEFRRLFDRIVKGVAGGTITLPPYTPKAGPSAYSKALQGVIERLRAEQKSSPLKA
jgi:hypothetical protein